MMRSSSSSAVVSIPDDEGGERTHSAAAAAGGYDTPLHQEKGANGGDKSNIDNNNKSKNNNVFMMREKMKKWCELDKRKAVHSMKVGAALVLVSLLYVLDPLFNQVGQNAMWAIMTVVVVFEFYAGATISKGINRGIGTILGGLLGCLAALVAHKLGGLHSTFVVAISVFIVGGGATYVRMVPRVKRKFDYGAMIFILTFNLVVVSGVRAESVLRLARERLSTIGMGFAVCIFTSLLIFPEWASDQLHSSTAANFQHIASSLEGCLVEYFRISDEKEREGKGAANLSACKSVLHSKSSDESLANFAKWEPWHGKFGFSYPWDKYMEIGEALRELAALVISLKGCIQSSSQPLPAERGIIKEACEIAGVSVACILRELGDGIKGMKGCRVKGTISPKLQCMKQDNLNAAMIMSSDSPTDMGMATFVFLLNEMIDKVEDLVTMVEKLGDIAGFHKHKLEVEMC
ncbi:unnamed protein product [Cuscuta campestris]|uniref:Aluminum-activated malate transporter n=1 Tax=Cuscuta campestris TaxID=132261 RepID=A0A484NM05_9ASTE|nr:unnamed protein product [Cuscuta campestris]